MPVYVALLRAVNVGGTGALPMARLKAVCEALGFADVATYIQSGNVVFRTDETEARVRTVLEAALAAEIGKPPGVIVRDAREIQAAADALPFPSAEPSQTLITFLPAAPADDALEGMQAPDGEQAVVIGREIHVHYPAGSGRSKLKLPALKAGTARNLNTVRKLAAMAAALNG